MIAISPSRIARSYPDTSLELARLIYEGVLRRTPSTQEVFDLATHLNGGENVAEQVRQALHNFIQSDEARSNTMPRVAKLPQASKLVGLGTSCFTAFMLQGLGLRSHSQPFDWLFSCADMIADCIEDDFETLLDSRFHQSTPLGNRARVEENCGTHRLYGDRYGIDFIFNHRDPAALDFEGYLGRCVARLRHDLRSNAPITFLMFSPNYPTTAHTLERLADALHSTPHRLLSVNISDPVGHLELSGFNLLHKSGRHELFEYRPTSKLYAGLHFEQAIDAEMLRALAFQNAA
ncbi:DUF1796 family putative cysteine peptidase [Sphingomonas montanisoli]|uniref:Papain-like cysteine peptidase n=1 Tax=Sphingomonas montanisoli TaxID=2606412 RepID=A0A5D9C345_9SPHN|nr:DUF1796 family putative cysteine peptidase [Sphingomonas montanisoli]TZG25883.1 hypothetical protein FYJ91_12955 [Sphingomonas montanisoli]